MRYYKFKDETGHTIDGIEIIQYSIMNWTSTTTTKQEIADWVTFLRSAHEMNEAQVQSCIHTECNDLTRIVNGTTSVVTFVFTV